MSMIFFVGVNEMPASWLADFWMTFAYMNAF